MEKVIQKKRFFFLLGGVYLDPTAIEIQACVRAKLFKQHFGITPTIITHGYHPHLRNNFRQHNGDDAEANSIPIFSVFDYYCDKCSDAEHDNVSYPPENTTLSYQQDPEYSNEYWGISADQRVHMFIEYTPDNQRIHYINYIQQTPHGIEIIQRDFYDHQGYLAKTGVVDPTDKSETTQSLMDRQGRVRMVINYERDVPENATEKIANKIFTYNEHGMVTKTFNGKEELLDDFLESLTKRYPDDELYFFVEHPIYYKSLRALRSPNINIISIFHNMHTITSDVHTSPFHTHFADTLGDLHTQKNAKTIILSHPQKNDIERRLGASDNLLVIPNTHDYKPDYVPLEKRDRFRAVALARLSEQKQLDVMITMFALVHKAEPRARLDIYGVGDLQRELQQLIDNLSLTNIVTLKGFTNDQFSVFTNAGMALLTSEYEGLPLVIMESLISGCPFISFDVKYGPSSMIKHGENGFLIPPEDIEKMAEKILYLFNNPEHHAALSHNAYYGEHPFDPPQVLQQWEQLLYGNE